MFPNRNYIDSLSYLDNCNLNELIANLIGVPLSNISYVSYQILNGSDMIFNTDYINKDSLIIKISCDYNNVTQHKLVKYYCYSNDGALYLMWDYTEYKTKHFNNTIWHVSDEDKLLNTHEGIHYKYVISIDKKDDKKVYLREGRIIERQFIEYYKDNSVNQSEDNPILFICNVREILGNTLYIREYIPADNRFTFNPIVIANLRKKRLISIDLISNKHIETDYYNDNYVDFEQYIYEN